ncbi:MAG: hypothetical protein JNJ44_07175 [Zoogloeaceae bacterium]|nr:hypothetical protein [Zoogloeaceae bacterium]
MRASFGLDRVTLGVPLIQLGCVWLAVRLGHGPGLLTTLALFLGASLLGWGRAIAHKRLIGDTPTSRVASAAQGYVELRGRGQPLAGAPVLSPVNGLPVLWYRVVAQRRNTEGKWEHESTVESDASFLLDDGSGQVAVDPEGATMLVRRKDTHTEGNRRTTQWSILRNDPIYVLGQFTTLGSIDPDFDLAAQVRDLLAEWKRDRPNLLARFDANQDGEICLTEWETARGAAKREVLSIQNEALSAPEAHIIRKPSDGRLYLISDLDPDHIARHFRRWTWFHATLFVGGAGTLAWLGKQGFF